MHARTQGRKGKRGDPRRGTPAAAICRSSKTGKQDELSLLTASSTRCSIASHCTPSAQCSNALEAPEAPCSRRPACQTPYIQNVLFLIQLSRSEIATHRAGTNLWFVHKPQDTAHVPQPRNPREPEEERAEQQKATSRRVPILCLSLFPARRPLPPNAHRPSLRSWNSQGLGQEALAGGRQPLHGQARKRGHASRVARRFPSRPPYPPPIRPGLGTERLLLPRLSCLPNLMKRQRRCLAARAHRSPGAPHTTPTCAALHCSN